VSWCPSLDDGQCGRVEIREARILLNEIAGDCHVPPKPVTTLTYREGDNNAAEDYVFGEVSSWLFS